MSVDDGGTLYRNITNQPGRLDTPGSLEYDSDIEAVLKNAAVSCIKIPEVDSKDDLPPILIIAGPCRTDTGALSTVFSMSTEVNAAHIQPFKTARRNAFSLIRTQKEIDYSRKELELTPSRKFEVIKETIGPRTQPEFFNPLEPLLDSGYPPDKIIVIGTLREPLEVFDSCVSMWDRDYISASDTSNAFLTVNVLFQQAQLAGIKTIPYVHEQAAEMGSEDYIRSLTSLVGISYQETLVNWGQERGYENTITYENPPLRFVKGSVSLRQGGRGKFNLSPHKYILNNDELREVLPDLTNAYSVYIDLAAQAKEIFGQISR